MQLGKGAASLAAGMVQKEQFDGYPLKVEYSLTDKGKRMLNVVIAMQEIGIELMKEDGKEDFLKN